MTAKTDINKVQELVYELSVGSAMTTNEQPAEQTATAVESPIIRGSPPRARCLREFRPFMRAQLSMAFSRPHEFNSLG